MRKYQVYDGEILIGEMTCTEGEKLLGVARRRFAECARSGGKLKNRYTVKTQEGDRERIVLRDGWPAEWEEATATLQDGAAVKRMIRKEWGATVRPFRRRSWLWKEKVE